MSTLDPSYTFQNVTNAFSLPPTYVIIRRYFVVCANGLSIVLLACGILILLGNRFVYFSESVFLDFSCLLFLQSSSTMFSKYSACEYLSCFSHSICHSNHCRTANESWILRPQCFLSDRCMQSNFNIFQRRSSKIISHEKNLFVNELNHLAARL